MFLFKSLGTIVGDTVQSDFEYFVDRRNTNATKWKQYDPDVLPFWVADMDFTSPPGILEALQARVEHGIFGYEEPPMLLRELIVNWHETHYAWTITAESIVFLPGVVPGFNWAIRRFLSPSAGLLIQSPVYAPIFKAAEVCGVRGYDNPLIHNTDSTYTIDFDHFEDQLKQDIKMFLFCNPHNPVGRVYRQDELVKLAMLCLQHNVTICSDEIHGDLTFHGHQHIPIASLDPEIASHTITLHAPSKTFNIAGLKCAYAVIPDPHIRHQFAHNMGDLLGSVNILGYSAALAAYQVGENWLKNLLSHLESNRDMLLEYIHYHIPDIHLAQPEGTYLAWLDCSALELPASPYKYFLDQARVALNAGETFGPGGEDFVRLNFGCPRSMLLEGLQRMRAALPN